MEDDIKVNCCFVYHLNRLYGSSKGSERSYLVERFDLQHSETIVFCDSQSTIHLTKNHMYHERNKRIDIGYHFIHEIVSQETDAVTKIATVDNLANMIRTKFSYKIDCSLRLQTHSISFYWK